MKKGKYTYDIKRIENKEIIIIRFSIDKDDEVDRFDSVEQITKQFEKEARLLESLYKSITKNIYIQKEIVEEGYTVD